MSELDKYLDQIGSVDAPSYQARQQFKQKISKLTIDQLSHEQSRLFTLLADLKKQFELDELDSKQNYAKLCESHGKIFSISGHLENLKSQNERSQKAFVDFQASMGKQVNLKKIQKDFQRQQNQKQYLDQMLELVNVPWTINQCIQVNRLP